MEMESTRRPFDRSFTKEPGLKKPRLTEVPSAPDLSSNGRRNTTASTGNVQRPANSNSSGGGLRFLKDRDSESSGSVPGPYQHQQLHQELVNQYKTALAELTFNSKPIITNLTIIAGENLHAAKAIAATVCANIIEVPNEQKLSSLYLLDSIVKNIGRDYIKYFASRLPEVFCKAYRRVDPSMHSGMRHLFGTWKGVFPPQSLQMIEKELGFTTTVNASSSGTTTSRPDSKAQCPAHSIHVNPKYLEARQRQQHSTRARGAGSDISETLVNSHGDVEALERTTSVSSGRSWDDSYAKHHHRDQVLEVPVRNKSSSVARGDSEYGSSVSEHSGLGTGRVSEKVRKQGLDRPWYESGSNVPGKISNQNNDFDMKHGFESYSARNSANSDSHLQLKQKFARRSTNGMSRSWKNSEEEEYIWDEMTSRPTERGAANTSSNDHWIPDNYEKLDFDSHLPFHDIGSRGDDEISADSMSTDLGQVVSGTRMPSLWSQELHSLEGMLSEPGKNISGYSEEYPSGLRSSENTMGGMPFPTQMGPDHIGAPSFKSSTNVMSRPKVSITQPEQTVGAALSSSQSPVHQRPPPSVSVYNPNQPLQIYADHNKTSIRPPADPKRSLGQRNMGSRDHFSQDSLPVPARDSYLASTQGLQPQNLRTSTAVMPPVQQRKNVPSIQQRKLAVSEFESSGEGQNLFPSQISDSENCSKAGNSSSDQSNPLPVDSPGRSITSSLLAAGGLSKPCFQEAESGSSTVVQSSLPSCPFSANIVSSPPLYGNTLLPTFSQRKIEQPPLPPGSCPSSSLAGSEGISMVVSATSNPVSSLLSSLVAKGLIAASKSDSPSSSSPKIPAQHSGRGPGVASTSSTPVSSVSVTMEKTLPSITSEPSAYEPAAKALQLLHSTTEIKNLIGFEFRPDVVRNFHPNVVSDLLADLPHQCSTCGLRLKLQEHLDRHKEWHALRIPEPSTKTSRRWYANSVNWVSGIGHLRTSDSASDLLGGLGEILESTEQMVPADESQCACILCGELFEDFYSQERDEWMFKGAVYMTIQSSHAYDRTGNMSDTAFLSPIVHANCTSEYFAHERVLACDVNQEKDT